MKTITEALNKLPQEKINDILSLLNIKRFVGKGLVTNFLTYTSIDQLLSQLNENELRFLKVTYKKKDGLTFGEIEKELDVDIVNIEAMTNNLSGKLLIYTIKNRQLLTKKLDKVYGISEVSEKLNIMDAQSIKEHLGKATSSLYENKTDDKLSSDIKNQSEIKLLKHLVKSGCITTLAEAKQLISEKSLNKVLPAMIEKKYISIYHVISPEFSTLIVLNEKIAPSIVNLLDKKKSSIHVNNRYNMLLNLLNAYDTISTFGLFLTKQSEFRKIDKKRIADSMFPLKDTKGESLKPEKISKLSLFLLNKLKCLNLEKDIALISLSKIMKDIDNPKTFLIKILKKLESIEQNEHFLPPIDLPAYKDITQILKTITKLVETPCKYFKITSLTALFANSSNNSITEIINNKEMYFNRIEVTVNFLCLAGIINLENDMIILSDVGYDIVSKITGKEIEKKESKIEKCIYINPDFSLIIPAEEISSKALYYLISNVEIIKDDIITHAIINKDSILKTHKRGMSLDKFVKVLEKYSKNEIPQNLSFLLNEWSNQTLRVSVSNSILLKTSHNSFIDEIMHSKLKNFILERISPNHAIVKKEHLDEIIKFARKNDSVISVFEDSDNFKDD
ncbi:helicase-associated domain-containing protein [Spirochaetota bacterium]